VAKKIKSKEELYTKGDKHYSFSTSTNLCQCTTVLIADVPNCHITLHGPIVSVRLHTIALTVQKAPHDLIIL